jgi:hypothetical protein
VEVRRDAVLPAPIDVRRDIWGDALALDFSTNGVAVLALIALVRVQAVGLRQDFEQRVPGGVVSDLPAGQEKSDWSAGCVRQRMDFGVATAMRATNRLRPFPLSARRAAVGLHGRRVNQDLRRRSTCGNQRPEDVLQDALVGPTDKLIVERLSWAVGQGRIHPTAPRLQNINDAADHPPSPAARFASGIRREMRLKPSELLLSQPQKCSSIQGLLPQPLKQTTLTVATSFMGPHPRAMGASIAISRSERNVASARPETAGARA